MVILSTSVVKNVRNRSFITHKLPLCVRFCLASEQNPDACKGLIIPVLDSVPVRYSDQATECNVYGYRYRYRYKYSYRMYFYSFTDLFYMNGHGIYVWSCFACSLLLMSGYLLHLIKTRQKTIRKLSAGSDHGLIRSA